MSPYLLDLHNNRERWNLNFTCCASRGFQLAKLIMLYTFTNKQPNVRRMMEPDVSLRKFAFVTAAFPTTST